MQSNFADHEWGLGDAPFINNRSLRDQLGAFDQLKGGDSKDRGICFRLEFRVNDFLFQPDTQFKLELTSADPAAVVWVNGQEVPAATKPKKTGVRDHLLPLKEPASQPLRPGRNVLAIKVTPPQSTEIPLLELRLDAINKPKGAAEAKDEVEEKVVEERAVVCDLCSSLPGQVPACVNACPHDAAMRVDARFEFPMK
jgi:ferredoxin